MTRVTGIRVTGIAVMTGMTVITKMSNITRMTGIRVTGIAVMTGMTVITKMSSITRMTGITGITRMTVG